MEQGEAARCPGQARLLACTARSAQLCALHTSHIWRKGRGRCSAWSVCVVSLHATHESHEPAAAARSSSVASVGLLFALSSVWPPPPPPPPPRRISSNDMSLAGTASLSLSTAMKQVPPDLSRLKIKIPQLNPPFSIQRRKSRRTRRMDRDRDRSFSQCLIWVKPVRSCWSRGFPKRKLLIIHHRRVKHL